LVVLRRNPSYCAEIRRTAQKSVFTKTTLDTGIFQSKSQPDAHATDQQIAA
jgi:hypothetical protein